MEFIIGWLVVVLALIVIIIIVTRKFGLLANIDVTKVASERERVLKQQIIGDRLRRRFGKFSFWTVKLIKPFSRLLRNGFDFIYDRLNAWQRSQKNRNATLNQEINKRIEALLAEAEDFIKLDRLDAAEKKYIEIIGLDSNNFTAFRELGDVYYRQQNFNEAKQTLEYALRLRHKITTLKNVLQPNFKDLELSQVNYLLALIGEATNDLTKATMHLKKALKIEKNNPRYLDKLIEISIIKKDKISALEAFDHLKKSNPENQKLDQFKQRIGEL
jgi:tetratricopeptide (TPR) repeat protein